MLTAAAAAAKARHRRRPVARAAGSMRAARALRPFHRASVPPPAVTKWHHYPLQYFHRLHRAGHISSGPRSGRGAKHNARRHICKYYVFINIEYK